MDYAQVTNAAPAAIQAEHMAGNSNVLEDEPAAPAGTSQLPDSGRPEGMSKIDLRCIWGGQTPATSPETTAGLWYIDACDSVLLQWCCIAKEQKLLSAL